MTSPTANQTPLTGADVASLAPDPHSPLGQRLRMSAAMDGAVTLSELEQVLADVAQDPELAEIWSRYHRVGEYLRAAHTQSSISFDADGIAARVADAIAQDAAAESELSRDQVARQVSDSTPKASQPIAWALAASVALAGVVSVLAWQAVEWLPTTTTEIAAIDESSANAASQSSVADASALLPLPPQSERIQRYLEQHHAGQTAGAGAIPGILPWVRVVGFDATRP